MKGDSTAKSGESGRSPQWKHSSALQHDFGAAASGTETTQQSSMANRAQLRRDTDLEAGGHHAACR
ncbi:MULTISPECIES: hypothetical protein [unclassified Mesorhizobium]|uniref:hypothetical protein n=1 Tax=unclassified Mesorhizobium TaxID=325217 RepID=UPI00333BCC39